MKRSKKWRTAPLTREQKRARFAASILDFMQHVDGGHPFWREMKAWVDRYNESLPAWGHMLGTNLTARSADDSIDGTGRVVLPEKAIEHEDADSRSL